MALFDGNEDEAGSGFSDYGHAYSGDEDAAGSGFSDYGGGGGGGQMFSGSQGYYQPQTFTPSIPQPATTPQQVMSQFQPFESQGGYSPDYSGLFDKQGNLLGPGMASKAGAFLIDLLAPGGGPSRMLPGQSMGQSAMGAMQGMFSPAQTPPGIGPAKVGEPGYSGIFSNQPDDRGENQPIIPRYPPQMMAPTAQPAAPPVAPPPPAPDVGGFPGWPDWQGEFAPRPWMEGLY